MKKAKTKKIRCAIYTRKSTDEGLEQDFNSLDAQREASEAYIKSQKNEGWVCLPEHYDDGGFTGGNMDRPAVKRLLADIEAGLIDCVVVYKVDRLSRSLMDFVKILTRFEEKDVSFVSVTQQFNSTTSMGRLTLNILLSFAQFEREVISERTRDKIAMARKKGKFSGGRPVLGYDIAPSGGELVINESEAIQVRRIFETYLQEQSLLDTLRVLEKERIVNKRWVTRKGHIYESGRFIKPSLQRLLTNPIYIGKIRHHNKIYEGQHEGIVDEEVFNKVGRLLASNRVSCGSVNRNKYGALLRGLLRCKACGCGMSHSFATKGNKRYHYYVCQNAQNSGWSQCPHPSLPASQIEQFVLSEILCIGKDAQLVQQVVDQVRSQMSGRYEKVKKDYAALKRKRSSLEKRLVKLSGRVGQKGVDDELALTQDQVRVAEQMITQAHQEILAAEREIIDEKDVQAACEMFDPIWETLSIKERVRIIQLLVERVEYDGQAGNVAITFHPAGIKALSEEYQMENIQ